jgi:tRNA pseudouridine38-40 synthase
METGKKSFRVILQYDGTAYSGWQVQPGEATIQGTLETVLGQIARGPVRVEGAGRTDAGVHALGQVALFHLDTRMSASEVLRALNSMLPRDIRVVEAGEAPPGFHPRFHAVSKIYYYQIFTGPVISPFLYPHAHHHRWDLDTGRMQEAARRFLGTHDFTAFCAADSDVKDKVRTVLASDLFRQGDLLVFVVQATGFLKQMVRAMAGTLIEAGRGKIEPDELPRIINARDRSLAGPTAPARGLFLYRVLYPEAGPESGC